VQLILYAVDISSKSPGHQLAFLLPLCRRIDL